ncbi:uncharacterized protein HD556DRAFT_1491606 [Suillus plorans]|uniref:FAD-binding domain-containing protein n=1 Tax=Suillus plorans TaxID=116603 RepID=A0A9P7DF65_9AGAM|nr:uncharacterized protein HD556DRAFT_1491606 [Suillus plorans]KAG1790114.1 hypothetical protein HD556DRAFT_1491606 [Suillus plorans]
MSLPENTTVLIVGAGPAGLIAALALVHNRCYDIVIVDAVGEGSNSSRSIAIHYAIIEALARIDVADGLLSRAIKGNALFIPVTELVLMQKLQSLGVQVQRPHKVVGMKLNKKDSRITDLSGMSDDHFQIRTIAGIGFSDPEGPHIINEELAQMVSADVTFEPELVGPLTLEGHLNGAVFSGNLLIYHLATTSMLP